MRGNNVLKPGDTIDTLMPLAEVEAAAARGRAVEDAIVAKHPVVLAGEPSRIILLSGSWG